MEKESIKVLPQSTPAYVYDGQQLRNNLQRLSDIKKAAGCNALYSIKALPFVPVIDLCVEYLDGLSVSSLFEARLAAGRASFNQSVHITTPGLRKDEFSEVSQYCSHVSFNSLNQFHRLSALRTPSFSSGLRINPQLPSGADARYNPCRPFSKLGVGIDQLQQLPQSVEGLHFHTVFSHMDYEILQQTVDKIKTQFGCQLSDLHWINLGGGYLYQTIEASQPFVDLVKQLKSDYELEVYIEPGNAMVGNIGYLISTVVDTFNSQGQAIAVLDTSVNQHPEVFEYQIKPVLVDEQVNGSYGCQLVGSSCLAGDIFGTYQFDVPLAIGDRVMFSNVGAYSAIKANRFNGYNLPDLYWIDEQTGNQVIQQSHYQDYYTQWGGV